MARGNFGNSEQHARAGRMGAKAQPTAAKAKGGRNSRSGSRSTTTTGNSNLST